MSKKSKSKNMKTNPGWYRRGSSGNPGGRPSGSRDPQPSALKIMLEATVKVADRTGVREMTVKEALQQRTFQNAVDGKVMAQREVLKWIKERDAWFAKHAPKSSLPAITRRISEGPDNADAALVLLGIAGPNPARAEYKSHRAPLLLELWAAQEALRRRRGGNRLTDWERAEIRRCTRHSDSLRWPRGTDA
jgi:hypothetical protein